MYVENTLDEAVNALTHFFITLLIVMSLAVISIATVKYLISFFRKLKLMNLKISSLPDGIVFGKFGLFHYIYSPAEAESHVACISKTGGGKTRSILIPTILSWLSKEDTTPFSRGNPGFAIDISGDIVAALGDDYNEDIICFEPLNSNSPAYDVLAPINRLSSEDEKLQALRALSFLLIPEEAVDDVSSYYERTGRDFLQACLITYYFKGLSFVEICDKVISSGIENTLYELADIGNPEALSLIAKFDGLKSAQLSNIYDAAHTALEIFRFPMVRHAFDIKNNPSRFDVSDIENNFIFLVIPDHLKSTYALIIRLLSAQVLDHISARENYSGKKILVALDEFGSFGKINITEPLEKYRKKNCRIMILFQSISQLDINYSASERELIFDNIAHTICLGTTGPNSQYFLANLIGKRLMKKKRFTFIQNFEVPEREQYPVEPYKFGRCSLSLYVISNNEYIKIRKNFIK